MKLLLSLIILLITSCQSRQVLETFNNGQLVHIVCLEGINSDFSKEILKERNVEIMRCLSSLFDYHHMWKVYNPSTNKYEIFQYETYDFYQLPEIYKENNNENKNKNIVLSSDEMIPVGMGSGFFISDNGFLITNQHVVENCDKVKVFKNQTQSFEATLVEVDLKNDLALIKVPVKPQNFLKIEDNEIQMLNDVIAAGFPLGREISSSIKLSTGTVTSLSGAGNNFSQFQTNAIINPGNSGGPIVNKKGNVVGVAVAIIRKGNIEGFNFGIKSSVLKTFVNANSIITPESNKNNLSNEKLSDLLSNSTVYMQCWMTKRKYDQMDKQKSNKAFYSFSSE